MLTPNGVRRVRAWVRSALRVEAGQDPETLPVTGLPSSELVAAVRRHRVVDLLAPHAGIVGIPADVSEMLHELREAERPRLMANQLELARLSAVLTGLDWLSLKGPALAVQTTGDPAARGSGDIDIVVRPRDLEKIHTLLMKHGWHVRSSQMSRPGTWAWRHLVSAYNEMTFDGPHSSVDVHWRLDPTHHGLPAFDEVWIRRQPVELAALTVDTLAVEDAFTHSCHHAAMDGWRSLRSLVDVHRLLRRPEVQQASVDRADAATMAVVDASIGLPEAIPTMLVRASQVSPRVVRRAISAQERPAHAQAPVPGIETMRTVRYLVLASRSPDDLVRAVSAAVLPASAVADLDDRTAWTALPRVLGRRVVAIARRLARWVMREQSASVAGPGVHR